MRAARAQPQAYGEGPINSRRFRRFSRLRPIREEYLIVDGGKLAGAGAHSYSPGDATGGAEEAARFSAE
ncbi:MAG TPA: hypothetical protein VES65_06000 [Solirubrobacteraceae bacterium]|nr:hypothetical protein [Solirubrobacteraceae bacterium]